MTKNFRVGVIGVAASVLFALPTLPALAAQSPSDVEMKAKLTAYVDALNSGVAKKAVAFYAEDATIEDPIGTPLMKGKEGVTAFVTRFQSRMGKYELGQIVGSPTNEAAMAVKAHVGPVVLNVIEVFTFKPDGKIASMRALFRPSDRGK